MAATSLELIEVQVMSLPKPDRIRLLDHLIASLDADEALECEWDEEADRREAEIESGAVQPLTHEEVMADLWAMLRK